MKWSIALLFISLALMSVNSEVIRAEDPETVRAAVDENQDGTLALFFLDSSLAQGSESGFWTGIVTSISHIFSGEDGADAQQQQIDAIEQDISTDVALVQIDVSNESLREIQESYDVTTVPFLIVFKRGIVVLKEVPTHETHDKILQVLNVNPAAVHADEQGTVVIVDDNAEVSSEAAPEATSGTIDESSDSTETVEETSTEPTVQTVTFEEVPAETEEPQETTEETTEEEVSVAPVRVAQQPAQPRGVRPRLTAQEPAKAEQNQSARTQPVNLRDQRRITTAPGEKQPQQQQQEEEHVDPDSRRKYVHHQCHDVTTRPGEESKNWRTSAFYINELEDYEIPEDWWRNGYAPITDPDQQQARTTPQPGHHAIEPIVPYARPAIVEPVRPRPFVEPVRPRPIVEPVAFPRFQARAANVTTNTTTTTTTTNTTVVSAPRPHVIAEPRVHAAPIVEPRVHAAPIIEPRVHTAPIVEPRVVSTPVVEPRVVTTPAPAPVKTQTQTVTKTSAPAKSTTTTTTAKTSAPAASASTSTSRPVGGATHVSGRPVTTSSATTRPAASTARTASSTTPRPAGATTSSSSAPRPSGAATATSGPRPTSTSTAPRRTR